MRWLEMRTAAGVALCVMATAVSVSVQAQPVMKLASATINDVQHEWLRKFEAGMKTRVGDKLKIEIYPASQLGAIPRMVEGVVTGTIEGFVTPYSFLVGTEPRYQIFDAIGVFEGPAQLNRVLNDPQFRTRTLAFGESKGLAGIGAFYNSPVIVLSKKPIRTLADFKGQKIRVFATPLQIEPMKLLGATPVPMALGEVMPALQSGTIDGMLAGIPVLTPMKFYDVAKTVTEIHPSIVVSTLVANRKWLDGLPPDIRIAILEVGAQVDKEAFGFASAIVERANSGWVANGGQLVRLPPAEQAKMMSELKALGTQILSQNPQVKVEYDELLKVVDRVK